MKLAKLLKQYDGRLKVLSDGFWTNGHVVSRLPIPERIIKLKRFLGEDVITNSLSDLVPKDHLRIPAYSIDKDITLDFGKQGTFKTVRLNLAGGGFVYIDADYYDVVMYLIPEKFNFLCHVWLDDGRHGVVLCVNSKGELLGAVMPLDPRSANS